MQTLLLLAGGALALYCLWQFRRWLGEAPEPGPTGSRRLETLVDELVATAEATSAVVQEKAEALAGLIAEADRRIGALSEEKAGAGAPVGPAPAASQPPLVAYAPPLAEPAAAAPTQPTVEPPVAQVPEVHRQVYLLADAGHDVTAIARSLGMTKGEVQLILGIRK